MAFYPVLVAGAFFLECFEVAVFSDMIDPLLDRGVWGGFGGFGDAGGERVQVDVSAGRE